MAAPSLNKLFNVTAIVIGIAIASFGELKFDGLGFIGMDPLASRLLEETI